MGEKGKGKERREEKNADQQSTISNQHQQSAIRRSRGTVIELPRERTDSSSPARYRGGRSRPGVDQSFAHRVDAEVEPLE